jgi:hypothetical protein
MLAGKDRLATPDAAEEIRRLEELWEAPAAPEPELGAPPGRLRALAARALAHPGWILLIAWPTFVASLLVGATAAEPGYVAPAWVQLVVAVFWLGLLAAAVSCAVRSAASSYAFSLTAAAAGIALAVGCTTTDHHTGAWWAYELGGSLALAGLSVAGLRRARRPPH